MTSIPENTLFSDRVQDLPRIDLHDIQCPICHNILWKPVACQSCETPFCSMCIDTWLKSNPNKCPIRCQNFNKRSCPRFLAQQLAKIQIACIHQLNGCNEVVCSSVIAIHISSMFHSRLFHTMHSRNMKHSAIISLYYVQIAG